MGEEGKEEGKEEEGGGDGEEQEEEEEVWVPTKLVLSLKFTARGAVQVREILGGDEGEDGDADEEGVPGETHQEQEQDHGALDAAVAVAVAIDTSAPPSLPTSSLLPVHHPTLLSILSPPPTAPPPLPQTYTWYPSAPPITTILPPGLPLSAHELLAFYPHHIRWKPLASRLARNGFTGTDIIGLQAWFRGSTASGKEGEDPEPGQARHPLRPREVNQWLRDALRGSGGYVKGSGGIPLGAVMGRGEARLDTEGMHPRKIAGAERGGEVCSLRDLVRGVRRWPWGVGRRALTRVLEWYVRVEGGFTPRLEVSVLCVGAVVRALGFGEERGTGPMNLDGAVLGAWRGEGGVERVVQWEEEGEKEKEKEGEDLRRSRVRINEAGEMVGVDVVLHLRHVLTFPYMAVGGMLCAALEMGIEKAEARKAEREARERSARGGVEIEDVEMRDGDGERPEQDHHHQTASTETSTSTPTPTPPSTRQAALPTAPSQDTRMLHPPALPAPIPPLTPPTPASAPVPVPAQEPPHIPSPSTITLQPPTHPSHNAPPTFTITYASATPPSNTPFAFHSTGTPHQAFPHLTTLHATTPAPNPQAPTIPTRYPPSASTPSGYLPHRETCERRSWDQHRDQHQDQGQHHQNQHHDTGERVSGAIGVFPTFLPPLGPASMMEHAGASDDNMAQYAYPPPGYLSGRQGGGEWWRR